MCCVVGWDIVFVIVIVIVIVIVMSLSVEDRSACCCRMLDDDCPDGDGSFRFGVRVD
jgi:hypothetical protein